MNDFTTIKIAVLLSHRVDVANLCRARNLTRLLLDATGAGGERASIVIGLPEMPSSGRRQAEAYLREGHPEIIVRPLTWEPVSTANARRMFLSLDSSLDLEGIETVVIPRDWGWNFTDCDAWISFADPGIGAVLPLRPIAYFCRDIAVRIVPHAFASGISDPYWTRQTEAFRLWRQSSFVATSDANTIDDLVGFAGVRREKTAVIPPLISSSIVRPIPSITRDVRKLVWWLEPSRLHDIAVAAEGLEMYLAAGGLLQPVIASEALDEFEDEAENAVLKALPHRLRRFMSELPRQSISSGEALSRILASAGVLWSSLLAGGDGEAVFAAAGGGTHFIGMGYAINRTTAESSDQKGVFYEESGTTEIAEALHEVERLAMQGPPANAVLLNEQRALQGSGFILDRFLEVICG